MFKKHIYISFLFLLFYFLGSNQIHAQNNSVFVGKNVSISISNNTKVTTNFSNSLKKEIKLTSISKVNNTRNTSKNKIFNKISTKVSKTKRAKLKSYQQLISRSRQIAAVTLAKSFKTFKQYNYKSSPYSDLSDNQRNQQLVGICNDTHIFITQHCIDITHTSFYNVKLTTESYLQKDKPPKRFS